MAGTQDISEWALNGNLRQTRWGTVTLTELDLTKDVAFDRPMPSASYLVFLERGQPGAKGLADVWVASRTPEGFVLSLSKKTEEVLSWLAVEK